MVVYWYSLKSAPSIAFRARISAQIGASGEMFSEDAGSKGSMTHELGFLGKVSARGNKFRRNPSPSRRALKLISERRLSELRAAPRRPLRSTAGSHSTPPQGSSGAAHSRLTRAPRSCRWRHRRWHRQRLWRPLPPRSPVEYVAGMCLGPPPENRGPKVQAKSGVSRHKCGRN